MLSFQDSIVPVLIADDHELTRFAIKLGLSSQSNIKIVGLASNGQEAIDMVKLHKPHVIILDLQMPIIDGLSASVYIKAFDPNIRIIAYTSVEDPQIEVMVQTAPIDIFCRKDISTKNLINLIYEQNQLTISNR